MLFIPVTGFVTLVALFAMLRREPRIIIGISIAPVSTNSLALAVGC